MSKIKAAILTAILGTSSAAMASPTVSFNANAQFSFGTHRPAPVIRDHGQSSMPAYAMPSTRATSQVALANYLSLSTGRDVLRPESNLRASALTLRANMGMAYIQKVTVRFHDGSTQVLNLNQWMTTRKPAIELALRNNRRIDSIVIVGTPSGRASYSVFAQNERAELPRPPVHQPSYSGLSGTYQSVNGDVILTQTGNRIHGTWKAHNGVIDGVIDGNLIRFTWSMPGNQGGSGVWYLDGAGVLTGTYGNGASLDSWGAWNLTNRKLIDR
jgi:hypothetical protein